MMNRPRGARPSPKHKAFSVPAHKALPVPDLFGIVPPKLSYWGNQSFGDCVSAEEAASKAVYSLMGGRSSEIFISEQTVILWARKHGYLNGADLTSVMESMAQTGMQADDGQTYTDGPYNSVDWTQDAVLSSAIYQGPVKIGVAANQLENVVGNSNGWILTGARRDQMVDHCVGLWGFGPISGLSDLLKVSVPSSVPSSERAYLLFTWATVGIIDQQSLIAICDEAWLRNPTTPQAPMPIPTPTPTPTPTPIPIPTPTPTPVPPTGTVSFSFNPDTRQVWLPFGWTVGS